MTALYGVLVAVIVICALGGIFIWLRRRSRRAEHGEEIDTDSSFGAYKMPHAPMHRDLSTIGAGDGPSTTGLAPQAITPELMGAIPTEAHLPLTAHGDDAQVPLLSAGHYAMASPVHETAPITTPVAIPQASPLPTEPDNNGRV